MVAASTKDELRRVLDDDGTPLPGARVPDVPEATLARIFATMLQVRLVDARLTQLQREGQLGFYLPATGEEATHFAVAPLRDGDWVFPSYREAGAWFWRGYALAAFVDQLLGNADDPAKGRQLPGHHASAARHLVSISGPVGTQLPQAVGAAYAARRLGKDDVTMAFFGEGAGSTGEFHVGLNFAGVWKAPCVFVCRTRGGEPSRLGRTLAAKARSYGVPALRVDGNDVLAVWQAASEAIDRARAGDGPTVIDAVTVAAPPGALAAPAAGATPATGDEPWTRTDPLNRLRNYLRHLGRWTAAREEADTARIRAELDAALAAGPAKPTPTVETMFDDVYETLPWHLREQRAYLQAQPRTPRPSRG